MAKNSNRTQITIAVIGLLGVLGAAIIANWDKMFPKRSATQSPSGTQVTQESSNTQSPGNSNCFEQYFSGVPKDRLAVLEAGAKDYQIIGPHQSKDQRIAVELQENRLPVGAIKFDFHLNNTFFKIQSVVDSRCQPVEDYANASRGGDKHILQNWDEMQLRMGNAVYTLEFKYGSGKIDADFIRITPER